MPMTPEEREELAEIIDTTMSKRSRIPTDKHYAHHEFVNMLIDERKRKRERWEKIRVQIMGWGIIAFLTAVGKAVYEVYIKVSQH